MRTLYGRGRFEQRAGAPRLPGRSSPLAERGQSGSASRRSGASRRAPGRRIRAKRIPAESRRRRRLRHRSQRAGPAREGRRAARVRRPANAGIFRHAQSFGAGLGLGRPEEQADANAHPRAAGSGGIEPGAAPRSSATCARCSTKRRPRAQRPTRSATWPISQPKACV